VETRENKPVNPLNPVNPVNPVNRYRSVILFVVIAVFIGVLILLQGKDSFFNLSHRNRVTPGLQAPSFTFPGLDGRMVSLADYRGKVVFLNIWATWCPPCIEEMPSIESLYQTLKGEDFEILAVSVDAMGVKTVAPFMKKYKLNFPVLLDTDATIRNLYGTTGVPESFIIDRKGIVVKKAIGSENWARPETIRFLRNLIAKPVMKN
jgi:peroxiredoxin